MKLKNRIKHAVEASYYLAIADLAHSDGRAAQANEDCDDSVADALFAEAGAYATLAAIHRRLAGDVAGALRSVPDAKKWARKHLESIATGVQWWNFLVQGVTILESEAARYYREHGHPPTAFERECAQDPGMRALGAFLAQFPGCAVPVPVA